MESVVIIKNPRLRSESFFSKRLLNMLPLLAAIVLFATACEPQSETIEPAAEGWQGTTTRVGDTTTVRTTSGSVWEGDGRLVEEVAIGTQTRGAEDLLGEVYAIDATEDRIFIADWIAVMVRVYDMAGNHVQNIGRHGGGPGEFYSITDLGVDPVRNELVVRENSGVVHRLTLSGEYVSRSLPVGQGGMSGKRLLLRVTREGVSMVRQTCVRVDRTKTPSVAVSQAFFTLDSMGLPSDTLDVPDPSYDPWTMRAYTPSVAGHGRSFRPTPVPFGPVEVWTLSMEGAPIAGRPSEYRFEVRHKDGRVTVFEREAEPVPVKAGEEREGRRRTQEIMRDVDPAWVWDGPSIPNTKPFYTAIIPDRSGRFWVLREGEGHPVEGWTEPDNWRGWRDDNAWVPGRWFEVFEEATGRYLGRVDVPEDFRVSPEPFIQGNTIVALTEDRFGTPIVKRYRVEFPDYDTELPSIHH